MQETARYEKSGLGSTAMLALLHSPLARGVRGNLVELRYQARRSGRRIALPVSYARTGDSVVVCVARADTKSWWRNFRTPLPVSVWIDGEWRGGTGHVAAPGSPDHDKAAAVYRSEHPRAAVAGTDPFVVIELAPVRDPDEAAAVAAKPQGLWRRWFISVTMGEFLGFMAPAAAGALTVNAAPVLMAAVLLGAGAVEGAVLGWFQARVLRTAVAGLRPSHWIVATVLGALIAWSVGSVPFLTDGLAGWPATVAVPAMVVGGTVLLLSIGVCQWFVLRRRVSGSARWIAATALAWLGGLLAFAAFTSPLWQPGQGVALVAAIGVVGGLLMAAVMAAITGWFLVRILGSS
ncbi:hypothetical protein [Nocardia sp. NPDC005366]|uniref:hypothetical protein n=1 Tax=Nocardia sp. NPDC005366 TaxID=3156878 RepID=UPI0033BB6348